jgi:hypothetical protein
LVEHQPSKLRVAGSRPVPRSILLYSSCAHVAQAVERILGKDEVNGSIPFMSTMTCISAKKKRRI